MTELTPATHTIGARRMGADGPDLPLLSLGSWHTFDRIDFVDAVGLVTEAVQSGVSLFDVGVYSFPGQPPAFTDVLFSQVMRASGLPRDAYAVSCKIWLAGYPERSLREQLQHAFFRAGLDWADIGMLGDMFDTEMDLDQLLRDMDALVREGLLRAWGVSNWPAARLVELAQRARELQLHGPQMVQLKYSVSRRAIADGAPYERVFAEGVTLQASDVLEGGILAGNLSPERQIGRDPGDVRAEILARMPDYLALAAELDVRPAQLGMAFALTHPHLTTVLFGASKIGHVRDAIEAVDLVERVGEQQLRDLVESFWVDRGIVDPAGA